MTASLLAWLAMDGAGAYVWSAYGASAALLAVLAGTSWRAKRRARRRAAR